MFTTALVESDGSKADRAYFIDTVQSALTSAGIDPPTKRKLDTAYTAAKSSLPPRVKPPSKAQKRAERAERQDGFIDDIDHAAALLREVDANGHLYLAAERVWLLRDPSTGLLRRASAPEHAGLFGHAENWTKRYTELLDLGNRSALSHAHRLAHAVTNAQSIHATIEQLDRHGDLVGTPDGVLDLRTGLVRRATNDERVTMSVTCMPATTYEGSAWFDWLQRVVPDPTERTLLQNLMGYTLCGKRDGKLFVVLYGTSGSGKSTFLETMRRVFGDYAATTPLRSLYTSEGENNLDYGYAALQGKRLASADELESRRTLAEDFIKALSTGASVTARKRFGHERDAVATACLWITTNDLPRIRNGGDALVVRARVFAWHQVLNQNDIRDRLKADLPAALAWAVEGARRYLADGPSCLAATGDMIDAAQEWLSDETYNPMRRFVRDCVRRREGGFVFVTDLRDAYDAWRRGQDGRVDAAFNPVSLSDALAAAGLCKSGAYDPCPAKRDRQTDTRTGQRARGWTNLTVGYNPAPRPITPMGGDTTVDGLPV
jgi:P4 family phage/plasmid primase-like protien